MISFKVCVGTDDYADGAKIRQSVFMDEQGFSSEFDDVDKRAIHIAVYKDGEAAATARAFIEQGNPNYKYTIGRVAVTKENRMYGLGKVAMIALEEHLKSIGAKELVLSAQCQAVGFYKKLGYEPYGEVYLDEHCPHQSMVKLI